MPMISPVTLFAKQIAEEQVGPPNWKVRLITHGGSLYLQARRHKVTTHAPVLSLDPLGWGDWSPLVPPIPERKIRKMIRKELRR